MNYPQYAVIVFILCSILTNTHATQVDVNDGLKGSGSGGGKGGKGDGSRGVSENSGDGRENGLDTTTCSDDNGDCGTATDTKLNAIDEFNIHEDGQGGNAEGGEGGEGDSMNYKNHAWGTPSRHYNDSIVSKVIAASAMNNLPNPTLQAEMPSPISSKASINNNFNLEHKPPDSFLFSARISTDRRSSTSFFYDYHEVELGAETDENENENVNDTSSDNNKEERLSIPYIECNSVGTTTPHIPTTSASFRAFPRSAHATSYTYTRGFIVPLTTVEIQTSSTSKTKTKVVKDTTSSGSDSDSDGKRQEEEQQQSDDNGGVRVFHAGDVIWVDGEYRMSSADENTDMSALIVDVPKPKRKYMDKSRMGPLFPSIVHAMNKSMGTRSGVKKKRLRQMDGTTPSSLASVFGIPNTGLECNNDEEEEENENFFKTIVSNIKNFSVQRIILSSLGLGLSSLMTYLWIKIAPLQLAVGIGGACMVGGGTLAVVMGGERLCDEISEYLDRLKGDREEMSYYGDFSSDADADAETEEGFSEDDFVSVQ